MHEQQDVSEFATFILNFARPGSYNGRWEARRVITVPAPCTRIMDSGTCHSPILLELAGPSLQHCVYSWYTQLNVHALAQAPQLLYLQLKRFREGVAINDPQKDDTEVVIAAGELVRIPCFDGSADISMSICKYVVVGVIYHIGASLKAGHYRSALSGRMSETSHRMTFYLSDDHQSLQKSTPSHADINKGGCLIGLRKLDTL